MNMMKKTGGFTLVELIVVIAILAILAGVAVPAYSGYIKNANDSAAESELVAVLTAAQAACAMKGTSVQSITIETGDTDKGKITVTGANNEDIAITDFYTAPTGLMATLAKHSAYPKAVSGQALADVTWSVSTGWTLK